MTAGSIAADLAPGATGKSDRAGDAEVESATPRQLRSEAKAAARAERDKAKEAERRAHDERAAETAAERDGARAAEQAQRDAAHQAEQAERAEAKEAARLAHEQATQAKAEAKLPSRRARKEARREAAASRRERSRDVGTDDSAATAIFSATPIADALSAEFPPPALAERPLSDMADREREIERRRAEEAKADAENSKSARRAQTAEAKAAARQRREEAKAAKAAAKAELREAKAAANAEMREAKADAKAESLAASAAVADRGVTARTDDGLEDTAESAPVQSGEAEETPGEGSRIERELAKAKARVEAEAASGKQAEEEAKARAAAQAEQDEADAKSRAVEEAARRDRAEADAKAREAKEEARRERDAAKAEAAEAKAAARRERDAAKAEAKAARRERDEAPTARPEAKAKASDDKIVEAPREPKVSLVQRLRESFKAKDADPDATADGKSRNALAVLAVVLGTLGFVFSVILAIGAFLVALSPHNDSGLFHAVSSVCDALVGPLRDVFSFSGVNGDSKDALVAWGLGALGYLIIGLFAQTFLRSHAED